MPIVFSQIQNLMKLPKVQMVSTKDVVAGYIQLKRMRASDNSEAAATASNDLNKALQFMDNPVP